MNILLTGATGLLGRAVYRDLKKRAPGFKVTGTAFSRAAGDIRRIDLLDRGAVESLIDELTPDLIIHAAAERRPDVVKGAPEEAEKLNIGAVETLARASRTVGAQMVYMSTDYVFDGLHPPYRPDAAPHPLNEYGRMKLEGEKRAADLMDNPIILRVPILYGDVETLSESAVTTIAESLFADKESYHDNEAVRYPTHVEDVAAVIGGMAELLSRGERIGGIYHWSGESAYTKFQIARLMADIRGIDPHLIRPAEPDPQAAPRPKDAHLDTTGSRELGLGSEIEFETALREILSRF